MEHTLGETAIGVVRGSGYAAGEFCALKLDAV
jgi:hypothetical protein